MKIGVTTDTMAMTMPIGDLAKAVEERGFESFWVSEQVHVPVAHRERTEGRIPADLHNAYWQLLDPFVGLAAAAAATSTIRLGTGICLITNREPLLLAKQIASLDVVSEGRFLFGFGAGWIPDQLKALGVPFDQRWKIAGERLAALKRLLSDDESAYQGEFVQFDPTLVYPKPVQKPHPPIYLGASTHWARQRVIDWETDGWIPNDSRPDRIRDGIQDLRKRAERAGRDPDSIPTLVWKGDPANIAEYEKAGADRFVFYLPAGTADTLIPELDRLARELLPTHA